MLLIPSRPRRPDFPPELITELELIGLEELRHLRYMAGNPTAAIPLLRLSIGPDQLEEWIAWKDADNAWWEARLYRVTMIGTIAAVIAALLALIAVLQAWVG